MGGVALQRWCRRGADALAQAAGAIDALNVFPVADADTGTNMLLTMTAAADAAEDALSTGRDLAGVAASAVAASLGSARGSSGVILSRFLHGLAAGFAGVAEGDGASAQAALTSAA